ncbi:MAG TPA: hypothetical protein VN493_02275 [Thermoanaerobaculia bacterium]|nr:hypothetical protein [Thermoanaerobaculia bacterium]
MTFAVGTIVARNYLAFARVLARSFREHHPHVPLFVLLADEVDGAFDPAAEPFQLLRLENLDIAHLDRFCFRYSRQQVVVAAKPYLLSHLLNRGFRRAAFLDADLLVLGDLTPLLAPAGDPAILLTPHLLAPLAGKDRIERELNILQSGIYNGGFLGVSDSPAAHRFLAWWQNRLYLHCRHSIAEGMHYDQRWLDLVPAFFEDVGIVRDPRYNVAHWNLPERDVSSCCLFHFSGFNPDEPRVVTKYSRRLTMGDLGPLFDRYTKLLEEAGWHESKSWPYAYDFFDNGAPIPDFARRIHLELGEAAEVFGNPFRTAPAHSYFRCLNEPLPEGLRWPP